MSAVEKSTVTSRLKGKDAEPYQPEESSRFKGKKRTADETVEYQAYSKPQLSSKNLVRPRKPRNPSSLSRGLKNRIIPQRMTKSGPVDSPKNPFTPELAPEETGESSSSKYVLRPAQFTPLFETPNPDPEREPRTAAMSSDSRKPMPNRRDNKAPSYDRTRPEELLRYIEDVEKELLRANINNDQDRKDWLRYYADPRSADEWTVLESYPSEDGSYKDFTEELISHYPEATDSLEGSIARLDKLCARSTPLTNEHLSIVLEFIRSFKFEGRKLLRGGCISNREIVTKFLNCLDPEFRKTVTWQMSQKSLNNVSPSDEARRKTRHHTDPIEFETLLKVSEELVRSFDSYNTITPGGTSETKVRATNRTQHTILQRPTESLVPSGSNDRMVQLLEDLNESMAKNTDILVSMSKENGQRHGETAKSIETVHTLLNTWHKRDDNKSDRPCNPSYPISSNRQSPRRDGCYYCWAPGHFIANCDFLTADIAEGKIESHDNGTRVDSQRFPREPHNVSPKDRVDLQWRNRKQLIIENLPEDSTVEPMPNSMITLQSNRNVRDKRDELIADLHEKARRAAEERDMWKAVTATRQTNLSVPVAPQVSQNAPPPSVQPAQVAVDPNPMEFMSMLAKMMSLSNTNQEGVEKGFPRAQ